MSARWWRNTTVIWFLVLGAFWLTRLQPEVYICLGLDQSTCPPPDHSMLFVVVWLAVTVALGLLSIRAHRSRVP